jgi:hypothetical protein
MRHAMMQRKEAYPVSDVRFTEGLLDMSDAARFLGIP